VFARAICEAAFRDAVELCDPAALVRSALAARPQLGDRPRHGVAIGKAALAMARGAGPVVRGVAITNADDGRPLPDGWHAVVSSHPEPDARSLAAADEAIDLVASAGAGDVILALISGGASALVERPLPGVTLNQLRAEVRACAAAGASIHEINHARTARSAIKGGKLAAMAVAPVVTLAISDVGGDELAVIGSGPTVTTPLRAGDDAAVIAPLAHFARMFGYQLPVRAGWGVQSRHPQSLAHMVDDVARVADRYATPESKLLVVYGEPTVTLPADRGEGGRAQQLALELARRYRGTPYEAFVAGSDGIDGPPPRGRPAPAGAYVDGTTWDAIAAAGIDPDRALARRDAGTALHAVGALVVTGPTGINHADVLVAGPRSRVP
jgi:hydroxypyruvate reductase